jgi:inner membrane protein
MPTVITHAVVGLVAARLAAPRGAPVRFWILSPLVAALPDADALVFGLGLSDETWSHRGPSHSLIFAAVTGVVILALAFRGGLARPRWGRALVWAYFTAVTATHGLLDAFTNGGEGIELLWPFSDRRYFWSVRPIAVAPLRIRDFFTEWGARVLWSEIRWVWLPLVAVLAVAEVRRARRHAATRG